MPRVTSSSRSDPSPAPTLIVNSAKLANGDKLAKISAKVNIKRNEGGGLRYP